MILLLFGFFMINDIKYGDIEYVDIVFVDIDIDGVKWIYHLFPFITAISSLNSLFFC